MTALVLVTHHGAVAAPDEFANIECNDRPLLLECLERQDAAREQIRGLRLTMEWQQSGALEEGSNQSLQTTSEGVTELLGLESLRLQSSVRTTTVHSEAKVQSLTETCVLSSDFFLYGVQPSEQKGTVQQFDFSTFSDLDERGKALHNGTMGQDILRYGYGDGVSTLHRHLSVHQDVNRLLVERQDDGLIRVARFSPATSDPKLPDCEWHIDPARDWLIVRTINRDFDGSILSDLTVDVEKTSQGIWFPMGFTRNGGGTLLTARLTQVDVNPELSSEDFAWQAFGHRLEGYRGFRKSLDGQVSNFIVENGVPIAGAAECGVQ